MENAYKMALAIADAVTKEDWINSSGGSLSKRAEIEKESWNTLKIKASKSSLLLHQTVFEKAIEVLSES